MFSSSTAVASIDPAHHAPASARAPYEPRAKLVRAPHAPISGARIDHGFGFAECTDGTPDFDVIREIILNGHHEGRVLYVIRGHVPLERCRAIGQAFRASVARSGGNRPDDGYVTTSQVGATQFSRSGRQYVEAVQSCADESLQLLDHVEHEDIERMFMTNYLERRFADARIHFGPSRYKSGWAAFATFRSWLDNGAMALLPHEDEAQLRAALADRFEIGSAQTVTAYNVCVEGSSRGGELLMWNVVPDEEARRRHGLVGTGYPYSLDALEGTERLSVLLRTGDVYFMNARFVHGVTSVQSGYRVTAGRFIGRLPEQRVVFWT